MSVIEFYDSRVSCVTSVNRTESRLAGICRAPILCVLLVSALVLLSGLPLSYGAETNAPTPSPGQFEGTNYQQLLQACLQIQERLQTTQLAIEQTRRESKEFAAQNAEALSKGVLSLQDAFSSQRARDLEVMQSSNRLIAIVGGAVAALGLLSMTVIAYFQWRTSKGLAEISAALPGALALGASSSAAALGPVEQSNLRLLGAMEHLDQRIQEFRRVVLPGGNGDPAAGPQRGSTTVAAGSHQSDEQSRISSLLDQAQSMMSSGSPAAAVVCLDELLSLDPNHAEALVKKGAALERLHKLNEAIECYDRAIAADGSMTLAYLHKGGLCNRLERFKEALECYGKALLAHNQRGGNS